MTKTGFYLDFSDFDKKFYNLVKNAIPEDARKGLFDAMNELLEDSVTKPPQAPFEFGGLWGSRGGTVEVEMKGKDISVVGGFNIKYAARHHEVAPGTFKYTTDKGASQPGPKYMQSKMAMYFKKYMEIVANTIKRAGK